MSQTLEATYDGQVFRSIQRVELQPDTQVQLVVTVKTAPEEKSKSFLRTARSALDVKGIDLGVSTKESRIRPRRT